MKHKRKQKEYGLWTTGIPMPYRMKIRMQHTGIGLGYLTNDHDCSSYGMPLFLADDGKVYGTGDKYPLVGTNFGYLNKVDGVEYTEEEIQWVNDYIVQTHLKSSIRYSGGSHDHLMVWLFGVSWKTAEQLVEIERCNAEKMTINEEDGSRFFEERRVHWTRQIKI